MADIVLKDGEEAVKRIVGKDGRISIPYKNRTVTIIIHKKEKKEEESGAE